MGCGGSKVPDVVESYEPKDLERYEVNEESECRGGDAIMPLKTSELSPVVGSVSRRDTLSKETSQSHSLMYSSFGGSKASSSLCSASSTSEVDFENVSQDVVSGELVRQEEVENQNQNIRLENKESIKGIAIRPTLSDDPQEHGNVKGIAIRPTLSDDPQEHGNVKGIAIRPSVSEESPEYGTLTTPNLKQINSMASSGSLQHDLNLANAKSTYKAGNSDTSSIKKELRGFHNYDHHQDMLRNHSQRSNFSREDSGMSGITMSSLYQSEISEKSKETSASGNNSSMSGMSNLSPILLKYNDDLQLEATKELYQESDCENSSLHKSGEEDVDVTDNDDVDQWKAYLQKMSTDRNGSNDDDEDSESGSASDSDTGNEVEKEDEVEGYFRYVTAEGHIIWILIDEGQSPKDINDEIVNNMMTMEKMRTDSLHDEGYLSPFHMSKEDALSNVTKVREFRNKKNYENALMRQQEEQARKLQAIRQNTTSKLTDEDGNEVGMSVAERKKLLWNSSGKLEKKH